MNISLEDYCLDIFKGTNSTWELLYPSIYENYIHSVFLGLLALTGILGNLIYIIKQSKVVRRAVPTRINDIQFLGLLLASFNILALSKIGFVIYTKFFGFLQGPVAYLALSICFAGTLGIPYMLICIAKEIFNATRNVEALRKNSHRCMRLVECILFLVLSGVIIFGGFVISPTFKYVYCIVPEVLVVVFHVFAMSSLIIGLVLSTVAYSKAKNKFIGGSSKVRKVTIQNMKVSVLYNGCLLLFWTYVTFVNFRVINNPHILWMWKLFEFISYICSAIFPFICELRVPTEMRVISRNMSHLEKG